MLRPKPQSDRPTGQSRLDEPLGEDDIRASRARGDALAFDPAQSGWLPADVEDADIADAGRAGWPDVSRRPPTDKQTAGGLTLREWHPQDAEVFHALLDDPEMWTYLPQKYPAPLTLDAARGLIELSNSSNHHEVRAVLSGGTIVGQVRLEFGGLGDDLKGAELSYWLGRAHWGQGLGARMVAAYVQLSRTNHPGLTSLHARVDDRNTASARILARAGFTRGSADPQRPGWSVYALGF